MFLYDSRYQYAIRVFLTRRSVGRLSYGLLWASCFFSGISPEFQQNSQDFTKIDPGSPLYLFQNIELEHLKQGNNHNSAFPHGGVFLWSGWNLHAWCSGGWRPLIAGCLSLQMLGICLPATRAAWDSNPRPPASESRPLTN